jgi:hypothetical protein
VVSTTRVTPDGSGLSGSASTGAKPLSVKSSTAEAAARRRSIDFGDMTTSGRLCDCRACRRSRWK